MNGFSRCLLPTLLLVLAGIASAEIETVTWLHTDHLGSPLMARDAQGNTLWQEDYSPWGERLAAPSANSADIGYTGHYEEADIGLTYAQARWYDPVVGRFLSADAVGFAAGGSRHYNRYDYTYNNPYSYTDPDGNAGTAVGVIGIGAIGLSICSKAPTCITAVGSGVAAAVGWVAGTASRDSARSGELDSADGDAGILMFHYSPQERLTGPLMANAYVTPDGTMSSDEATNYLALDPNVSRVPDGTQLYVHPVLLRDGEYRAAENSLANNVVAPSLGRGGGGVEFRTNVEKSTMASYPAGEPGTDYRGGP